MIFMPKVVPNLVDNTEQLSVSGRTEPKFAPATGEQLSELTSSTAEDVEAAVASAEKGFREWGKTPAMQRCQLLHKICDALEKNRETIAEIVAVETGKSSNDALGETMGAIALGRFYAAEGQRLFGRTTNSGTPNKYSIMVRQPVGIAALIIAANTPIANVAWKVFPALACGNTAILKASEDAPATAWIFGSIAKDFLPAGVLNIIQGLGETAGAPLVENKIINVISFTGSTAVGKLIAQEAGKRLARVSLELGGKNPLVVCDDADLDNAVKWALLSAFSNAGQRCASASRIIIFDSIYEKFKTRLLKGVEDLKLGVENGDDVGPVINLHSLENMEKALNEARGRGVNVLVGGTRVEARDGYYMSPTLLEDVPPEDKLSNEELFGPIASLYKVRDFKEALELANNSPYGLTAAIHTKDLNRAWEFSLNIETGMTTVNGPTYGSEPHMPFGGRKNSGNGTREPGPEALDVYCEWKNILMVSDPTQL